MSGLPVLTFDESAIPPEHQFEVFRETAAPVFDTRPLDRAETSHASAVDYLVDGLVVSRLQYGPQVLRRTARHTAVAGDCLAVLLFLRGGLWGAIHDDGAIDVDAQHVAILDLAHPFSGWTGDSDVIWVTIPRARLGPSGCLQRVSVVNFHRRSPRGRVLSAAVEHLWAEVAVAADSRAEPLAAGIIDAVRAVLRPGDFEPDDHSLGLAMEDYIAANLADLTLGPNSLRATFFCSRSAVYRLFRSHGGIAAHIRDQRLLRCFDDLTAPSTARRRVIAVATRWGFENPSHFNRLFKARFGLPPSRVVARPGDLPAARVPRLGATKQITEFHHWAASL